MTPRALLSSALALVLTACNGAGSAGNQVKLDTESAKVGYSIGLNIGKSAKRDGAEIPADAVAMGINDGFADKPQLTEDQVREVMRGFQQKMMKKLQDSEAKQGAAQGPAQAELAKKNQEDGDKFLAENAKKAGIKVTATGLQYQVISEGKGKMPKASDTVSVHYTGTLLDGTKFDSSVDRNEPASFPVSGVIPGWTEVLQLMKEGAKYKVFIPSKLAYGERGAGDKIGPNSTLIFDVELLSVK